MDRKTYNSKCAERWYGPALMNAEANWHCFIEIKPELCELMQIFRVNPCLEDLSGQKHNLTGSMTGALWEFQLWLQPDRSCLLPLLDFEERYQKVFLRRGLVIFCSMILNDLEACFSDAQECTFSAPDGPYLNY